jgi:PIN domain nuclease of toxin-antitoxin system
VILLDTHILVWWITNNPALGDKAKAQIESAELAHFSAASVFEIEIKKQKIFNMPANLASEFARHGFTEAPITSADAATINQLSLARHDPFDQLLLAQAKNRGLTFITADSMILERGFDFVVDAQA